MVETLGKRDASARRLAKLVADLDLGTPFELDGFLQRLGEQRGRPIVLSDEPTLANIPKDHICGLWVKFPTFDQLYIRAGLAPLHREAAGLHEVGHVLLDHGGSDQDFSSLVPALAASGVLNDHHIRARSQYHDESEAAAERFGRAILARAGRYNPPPPTAQPTAPPEVANVLHRMAKMYTTPEGTK